MKKEKNRITSEKGITGIDIVIGLVLFTIFAALIAQLLANLYKNGITVQKSAYASAYITIFMEKVDEKSYDDVVDTRNFLEDVIENFIGKEHGSYTIAQSSNDYEFEIDGYKITFTPEVKRLDQILLITIKVDYDVVGANKSLVMQKIKIAE